MYARGTLAIVQWPSVAIGGNALPLFSQEIQWQYHVILPSCRVYSKLTPALLVYTVVYTIVVDDHENNWKIVPVKNETYSVLIDGFRLLKYLFEGSGTPQFRLYL